MASNKVLKVALGKSEVDEQEEGLHRLSERVSGNVGLFFTTLPRSEVEQLFSTFQVRALAAGLVPMPSGGWSAGKYVSLAAMILCMTAGTRFCAARL